MKAGITYKHRTTSHMPKSLPSEAGVRLADHRKRLKRVAKGGFDAPESAINLPFDKSARDAVLAATESLGDLSVLRFVILIGIGGSSLGTEAVYKACRYGQKSAGPRAELIVVDTVNPRTLERLEALVEAAAAPEEFAIVVVSKSGKTAETIVNAEALLGAFTEKFGEDALATRTLVATDIDSPLLIAAEERNWQKVAIPKQIGGRFSLLSAAGLLPLSIAGLDINALAEGAAAMRDQIIEADINKDIAAASATFLYHHGAKGMHVNDHFFFTPELDGVGAWYRQLFAESLGKQHRNDDGTTERTGMLPTVSIGSNDLHSVAQLYFGGPQDRATTFIIAGDTADGPRVRDEGERIFPDIVPEAAGKSAGDLLDAIYEGTKAAYKDAEMPYTEAILADLSERSVGAFVMWKMIEVMYLAALWGVNAFDQPEVERYKSHTREIFKRSYDE